MSPIFINYRRLDTAPYAGRLYDRLVLDLGRDLVFMDIDKIDPGDDWIEVIEQRLQSCSAVIALIGPTWADCKDESGGRRLDNPDDHVRRELVVALQRRVRVVPVLVGGTKMPRSDTLPPDLAPLLRRNAIELSDQRFHHDVDRLVAVLRPVSAVVPIEGLVSPSPALVPISQPATNYSAAEMPASKGASGATPPGSPSQPDLRTADDTASTAILPATVALQPQPDLRDHQKPVTSVAFSPDGSVLASAGGGAFLDGDTAIRIWSLPEGGLLRKISGHKKRVTCVVFSPDGKTLAACSEEAVRLWRVGDGKRLLTIEEDYGDTAQFSSDGTQLLSGIRMHRTTDGEQLRSLGEDRGVGEGRRLAALMPDPHHYVSVTTESWQICRIDGGKPVLDVPLTPAPKYVFSVQLSVDGLRLAISGNWGDKNRVAIFDTRTGKRLWAIDTEGGVGSLRFHPSGTLLAGSYGLGNEIALLRSADGEITARVKLPAGLLSITQAHGIAFSPDGKQLAAACSDAVVRLWEMQLNP
jgi:hypothetical protein